MSDFEIWIYRLIIAALAVVVWYAVQRLIKKFDELIDSINKLKETYAAQEAKINGVNVQLKDHTDRLNDHGKRIRQIEINNAQLKTAKA